MAKPRKRPHKMPADTGPQIDVIRSVKILYDDIDRENRSIPIILASESPVETYDIARMEVVNEVLSVDGVEIPSNGQVPMVDNHERDSVRDVLGSIREFTTRTIDGVKCLVARAFFAADVTSRDTFEKYADGHLTDFSVGAIAMQKEYQGKTKNVTRSKLIEGSAAVIGSDRNAKAMLVQRAYREPQALRDEIMDTKLKELLVQRGLPEDATDKTVLEFVERQLDKPEPGIDTKTALEIVRQLKVIVPASEPNDKQNLDAAEEVKRALERYESIDELCRKHNVSIEDRTKYLKSDASVDAIARTILEELLPKKEGATVGPNNEPVEVTRSERDKFYDAVSYGVIQRSLSGHRISDELQRQIGEKPVGADEFRFRRIPDIAREFCQRADIRVEGIPDHEICRKAVGIRNFVERSGTSFHSTGSFTNIFLDAMNKTLRAAYDEAPSTYQRWVRQASSASDFKTLNRIVFGEIGLPEEVEENGKYPEMTTTDSKESYRVTKHGGIFSITLEMMVNDDMDAMTRIPRMQGNAMRRKINLDAYSILTDNAALADGVALFHASSHGANLDATALAEGALDTGYSVMMTQTGTDSSAILNIMPRFLIVPAALSATAYRLTGGGVIPQSVSNVPLYGPGGPRTLEVVVDGQLDGTSATGWYLAADNNVVDTVEITFLQGEETPVLDREDGFDTDTIKYKIRQSYGIKAIDYRGLYQGNS